MTTLRLLVAAACLIAAAWADIETDEGVLVLKKDNFQTAIDTNEFVLVEFYAPWCGHCKALAPEYAKAAKLLADADSPVKLAKVDATEEGELAEQFKVGGYPTLKFFRNGNAIEYGGGRQAADIVSWVTKKSGPAAKELATVDEAKALVESAPVVVIGFFKDRDSAEAKAYLAAAGSIDDYAFGITSDDAVYAEYGAKCGQVELFKKFDEGRVTFAGDATADAAIRAFVSAQALPLVVEFNSDNAQKIFGGDFKSHMLMFVAKGEDHYERILAEARSIAADYRSRVLFVSIDATDNDHKRILEFFGMKADEVPAVRLIKLEDEMSKFKPPTTEITAATLREFVDAFLDGKLKPHLLSQDVPEDWDKESVKVLVSHNFDEVAMDKGKHVLVEFYAPWCGHCKQLEPIYKEVGDHFESKDDVVVAKMDATANELEHTKILSFPTLKLYKKETNEVVDYKGPRTKDAMIAFLESGGVEEKPEGADAEEADDDHAKDEL